MYQHLYCILRSHKLTVGGTVNINVHVYESLREQEYEDLWLFFETKRAPRTEEFGKH
jgi:hypothetical protein